MDLSNGTITPEYVIRVLGLDSPPAEIVKVLSLCRVIFDPEQQDSDQPQLKLQTWLERLQRKDALLIYACVKKKSDPNFEHAEPLGFFFSYAHNIPELAEAESLHIWMAGIHPDARGKGLFPILMSTTRSYAKAGGYLRMTVCTLPAKFARMFAVLKKTGWQTIGERDEGQKVVLRLSL